MKTTDKSAAEKAHDEMLSKITEETITRELRNTLERTKRWYELKERPIVSTDVGLYIKAFDEILVLDALPDVDTSGAVN
jgi:hypothetical protein